MKPYATFLMVFLLFLSLITTISCEEKKVETPKIDTAKEAVRLMQVSRDWSAAATSRDIEKTLEYWADDAVVISCGEETLKGKAAIRQMVEGSMNDPNFSISWEPIRAEISKSGDMGYLLENSKITMTDSTGAANEMNFDTVTIWKKQDDGSWKNVVDVMSSNE